MEKNAALILVGFDPKSQIEKESLEFAFEEAIFTEASFFMLRSFIPKLAESRIRRLLELVGAGDSLEIEFPESGEPFQVDIWNLRLNECQKIMDLVQIYQESEMGVKLKISNEENPHQLIEHYQKWISLFSGYARRFVSLFENLNIELSSIKIPSVSIATASDYNVLVSELKKDNYCDSVYQEYLRVQKMIPIPS